MEQHENVPGKKGRQGGHKVFRRAPDFGGQQGLGGEAFKVQTRFVRLKKCEEGVSGGGPAGFVGSSQCRVLSHTSQNKTIGNRTRFVEIVII